MRSSSKTVDMLNGPVLPQILRFSMPLAATGILQLLFNAADAIVVGKFAGSDSLAAVGTTGSLISLLVGLFMGLSVGVNVLVARGLGCQDEEDVRRVNHSGVALSLLLSAGLVAIGLILSKPLLRIMDTPEEILPLSQQYLNIYFLGTPFSLLYNFLAASLRACGDTKRPLYFLTISGLTNVVLNLFFVIVLEMGVTGVAIATVISQGVSVALIVLFMMRMNSCLRLEWKRVRIDWSDVKRIVQIGIPAGLQGVIFSISNVMIQGSINSFGPNVMAANTAAGNLDGFVYTACNSVSHAAITFTSQNLGARQYSRIKKVTWASMLAVSTIGIVLGAGLYLFREPLLSIYVAADDPSYEAVLQYGVMRLGIMGVPYFLCGTMEVGSGVVRGLGRTWLPMIVATVGSCVTRIVWILTVFEWTHDLFLLYLSYPISWVLTTAIHVLCIIVTYRKVTGRTAGAAVC